MMRKVLITGASGFCARHLVARLCACGGLHVSGSDLAQVPPPGVVYEQYLPADITDPGQVAELVRRVRPDWVFHLAGVVAGADAANLYRVNVCGTINLLDSFHRYTSADSCLLVVGSAAEYGSVDSSLLPVAETHVCQPCTSYGISKYAATMAALDLAKRYGRNVVVARPFNIIGAGVPTGVVLGAVLQRIKAALVHSDNPVVRIGNTSTKRDFIAAEDVADAYVRLMEAERWGEIFNICSGRAQSIQSLLDQLVKFSPCPITFQEDTQLLRSSDHSSFYGSNQKAVEGFGFAPAVSVEDALASAWRHAMEGD